MTLTYEPFTLKQFEEALKHGEAERLGLIDGEYTFRVTLDGQSGLMIRSTVNTQEVSKPSGKNSIRVWLVDSEDKPIGGKIGNWINRTAGWQDRLNDKMLQLTKRRELVGDCKECGKPIGVFKNKNSKKLFAKCWDCKNSLGQLDSILPDTAYFSEASHNGVIQIKAMDQASIPKHPENQSFNPGGTPTPNEINVPKNDEVSAADFIAEMVETNNKIETPKLSTGFEPSQYQKDIFEFVESSNGNGIVNAVAGSGKTTTNVMALELLPKSTKAIYAAFNKHIERDIVTKAPQHVKVSTFHSWGLGNIRKNSSSGIRINQYKVWDIIDDLKLKSIDRELKGTISKLISLLKGGLLEPTQKNILRLADDFCIDIEPQDTKIVTKVFDQSIRDMKTADFDDMIYYPASGIVPCEKYEYIFVDEAQDLKIAIRCQFQQLPTKR